MTRPPQRASSRAARQRLIASTLVPQAEHENTLDTAWVVDEPTEDTPMTAIPSRLELEGLLDEPTMDISAEDFERVRKAAAEVTAPSVPSTRIPAMTATRAAAPRKATPSTVQVADRGAARRPADAIDGVAVFLIAVIAAGVAWLVVNA